MTWAILRNQILYAADGGSGGGGAGDGGGSGGQGGQGAGQGAGDGGAGGGQKPWYDGMDAETLGHIDNKGWKKDDPKVVATEAIKQAREAQKFIGVPADQIIRLPKDANDEAGWKAVHARLGVPDDAKGYDLSTVARKDGSALDTGLMDKLRSAMLSAAVTKDKAPSIAKAVVEHLDGVEAAKASEKAATLQKERGDLQKEWGTNWEMNRLTAMQGAKRAAGSDDGAQKLISAMENAIGYKATMEFWRKIGAGTTEDTFVETSQGGHPTTVNGARARLAELQADPEWAKKLFSKTDGAAEKREFANLMELINGAA